MLRIQTRSYGLVMAFVPVLVMAFTGEAPSNQKHQNSEPYTAPIEAEQPAPRPDNALAANEIYHWVDENGVVNYSQQAPGEQVSDFNTLTLSNGSPDQAEEDDDPFNVAEQAERMKALRAERAEKRAARRQRQQMAEQRAIVQYREPDPVYPYVFGNRPDFPGRPPQKPTPPIEEIPNVSTFKPPGQSSKN